MAQLTKKNKKHIITYVIIGIFFTIIFIYSYYKRIYIEKDSAYVIGNVYSIYSDPNGLNYKFWYKFNGVKYYHWIGSLSLYKQKNLILLKISRKNPKLWIHIEEDMPECIILNPNFDKSWKSTPNCNN